MNTILNTLISAVPNNTFTGLTTVWNYHHSCINGFCKVIKNKNSNIHKWLSDKSNISDKCLKEGLTIVRGAIGRTQHSATELIVFCGDQTDTIIGGVYYTFNDLIKLGVR